MEIFTGIILYLCYWWLAFMIALPCGVQVGKTKELGFADSAPINPKIGIKSLFATIVSMLLWGVTYAMIHFKFITINV